MNDTNYQTAPTERAPTMSVTIEELVKYVDKAVVIHFRNEEGGLDEIEATVKAVSQVGLAYRAKGSSNLELCSDLSLIEEIADAPAKRRSPTRRRLDPVPSEKVIQHLLDRHAVPLDWAKNVSEEDAEKWHNEFDHTNLGHFHEARKTEATDAENELADDES